MIKFNFLPKFSVVIIFVFIITTIIGTLSHEYGHITVAKFLDYDTRLNYGSMNYFYKGYLEDNDLKKLNRLTENYDYNNYDNWPDDLKLKVEKLNISLKEKYPPISKTHQLMISIGGPIQTILTSCIGLFLLLYRKKLKKDDFTKVDWISVFLSLFILREVFNFVTGLYSAFVYNKSNFNGDEFRISRLLGYNEWVIPSITFLLGMLISIYVIFKVMPLKYRFSFIISGFVGGVLGFVIWYGFLGKALFH